MMDCARLEMRDGEGDFEADPGVWNGVEWSGKGLDKAGEDGRRDEGG